jgi:hypothetical protein
MLARVLPLEDVQIPEDRGVHDVPRPVFLDNLLRHAWAPATTIRLGQAAVTCASLAANVRFEGCSAMARTRGKTTKATA